MEMCIGSMLSITAGNARVRVSWIEGELTRMIEGTPEVVRRAIPDADAMVCHIGLTARYGAPVIVYDLGTLEVTK